MSHYAFAVGIGLNLVLPACSLNDLDSLRDNAQVGPGLETVSCPPSQKLCNGACRFIDDPGYGCASADCTPCDTGGSAMCLHGVCRLAACAGGGLDCDGDKANGCEVDPKTDPQNCGGCGNGCGSSECLAGLCGPELIADGQRETYHVAVSDTHVYWTNGGGPALQRLSLSQVGSSSATEILDGSAGAGPVVVDETHVYWTSYSQGFVRRQSLKGGAWENFADNQNNAYGIVEDATHVYWTRGSSNAAKVVALDKNDAGGTPVILATDLDSGGLLTLDSTHVYLATFTNGIVHRIAKDGSGQVVVAKSPGGGQGWGIARFESDVYWLRSPYLLRAPATASGVSAEVVSDVFPRGRWLAAGSGRLFAAAGPSEASNLYAVCPSGSPTIPLATVGQASHGVAVTDTHVYYTLWGSGGAADGAVLRVEKPSSGSYPCAG